MVNRGFYRSSPTLEMVTEAITKANEPLANSRQQPHLVVGSRVFLTPSGTVPIMFHLAMPCFLIKLVLSLLFNKNQSDESDKVELVGCAKSFDR
jgi:flagellar motor switch protein FliM